MYSEETDEKKNEDYMNRCKDILYLLTGRNNAVKMTIILKVIYKFNAIPIKIAMHFSQK